MWGWINRIRRSWSEDTTLYIVTVLSFLFILLAPFVPSMFDFSSGRYSNFKVLDVVDGRTLKVRSLEQEDGVYPEGGDLRLGGILSDKSSEFDTFYENRIQFFREHLLGHTIQGQVYLQYNDPNPPSVQLPGSLDNIRINRLPPVRQPPFVLEVLSVPSEVLLKDGTSLNELLLARGYAFLDFTDLHRSKKDQERYESAQERARTANLGIWSSPESVRAYQTLRDKFELQESLKRAGLVYYIITQVGLAIVILMLMYVSRQDKTDKGRKSYVAASKLLAFPGTLLLVELLRWTWMWPLRKSDPYGNMLYAFHLFFVGLIIFWGGTQFFTLVRHGPLKEWQTLWAISEARRVVWSFFSLLWCLILIFGIVYRIFGGAGSLGTSMHLSLSKALSLGYPVTIPKTLALDYIMVLNHYAAWLLLAFCVVFVPEPREKPEPPTLRRAVFLSLSSCVILVLVVASVFANLYYYNIHLDGFSRPLNLAECFLFALTPILKTSYGNVYASSNWLMILHIIEIHLIFFLYLVGWRSILTVVKEAVARRHAAKI